MRWSSVRIGRGDICQSLEPSSKLSWNFSSSLLFVIYRSILGEFVWHPFISQLANHALIPITDSIHLSLDSKLHVVSPLNNEPELTFKASLKLQW